MRIISILEVVTNLHESLCHPGITRWAHYIKVKNLPFSLSDIKNVIQACKDCSEVKASFLKPEACPDIKSTTVIKKLTHLFSIFGFPGYVHSDQGSSFMSFELKLWLHNLGVPTSRTNRYNPAENGQVERCNHTIWQTVLLVLRSTKLPLTHWEYFLTDKLHSIRSLLCTATNCTPHKRMFSHSRKSFNGVSLPSWVKPGPIYVKCHVRNNNDTLVEEAELIEANPHYARVKLNDGKEINDSLRDLARNPVLMLRMIQIFYRILTTSKTQFYRKAIMRLIRFYNLT